MKDLSRYDNETTIDGGLSIWGSWRTRVQEIKKENRKRRGKKVARVRVSVVPNVVCLPRVFAAAVDDLETGRTGECREGLLGMALP